MCEKWYNLKQLMCMKKLKKLVLKKETIVNLSVFEQSRIKGGTGTIDRYLTGTLSHFEVANCINGYGNSDPSYCISCTGNENTCDCTSPSPSPTGFCYSANEYWTCGPGMLSYNCNTNEAYTFCCF